MRQLLTGIAVTLLLLLNTLVLFGPLMVFALLKLVFQSEMRDRCSWAVMWIAETWSEINKLIFRLCLPTQWEVRGDEGLRNDTSYLVVSNHQSWVDIPALVQSLNRRTPFFKFFLKKELIWVPFLGLAWWALDYPFMKRFSRAEIEKNPSLKGKDLETTRKACEKFKYTPVAVFNFLEGTRFTPQKHEAQQSPYRYLLKPKAGGAGFVLGAMGQQLHTMLNITIHYPGKSHGFWDLLSGRIHRVIVRVETLPIPPELLNRDYLQDEAYRLQVQQWVGELWRRKDAQLATMHEQYSERD